MSENAIVVVSDFKELEAMHNFMQDEQLDKAMEVVLKLIVRQGEIPAAKAVPLIVELQALATKFAFLSAQYATFDAGPAKSDKAHRKNVYYTAKEAINKLVDALKFVVKNDQ